MNNSPQSVLADQQACAQMLRDGSKSFSLAQRLLPARVAQPVTAFYAFCRSADDAIDESEAHSDALAELQLRLDAIFLNEPLNFPEDRAFARVVRAHNLPRAPLDALLEGFAWDAEGRTYNTRSELTDYAARVAGSVGVVMALIMGESRSAPLARALDLGVAMQLTNICRDVGEDARMGRVYLPRDALTAAGVATRSLSQQPRQDPALEAAMLPILAHADELYARAQQGIRVLPMAVRFSMRCAAFLYQAIGHTLRANGCDSITRRTVVPRTRQLLLMAKSLAPVKADPALLELPVLPECEFLHRAAVGSVRAPTQAGSLSST